MKIACISDTHSLHHQMKYNMPEADILCIAGDFTNVGAKADVISFGNWLSKLPYKKKIIIAGNHDWCFANHSKKKSSEWLMQDKSIVYLENSEYIYNGIKFYGSPITPTFCNWAFMADRGEQIKKYWDNIPEDTDVLITHGPPKHILDPDRNGFSVGDEDLLLKIAELSNKNLKAHIFGHLHGGYGTKILDNIHYVNAAICDDYYDPINKPIVIEI